MLKRIGLFASIILILFAGLSSAEVTLFAAVPGVTENESAASLFDGKLETKWCVNLPGQRSYNARFSVDAEVRPAAFILATANDDETYPGRCPEFITLYGSAAKELPEENDATWQVILDRTPLSLPERNCIPYGYALPSEGGSYRHFWLKLEKQNGDCMQISEFALLGANQSVDYPVPVLALELQDGTLTATDSAWTRGLDELAKEGGPVPLFEVPRRYAMTTSRLHLRRAPNTNSESQLVIQKDGLVYVLYAEPNEDGELWAMVEVDGKVGFVMTDYLILLTKEASDIWKSAHPTASDSWSDDDIWHLWMAFMESFRKEASTPRPIAVSKEARYDVPSVLESLGGKVARGQFGTQKETKYKSTYNFYSYDNWEDPAVDESPYIRLLSSGNYPFILIGTKEEDLRSVGSYHKYYCFRYTGSKTVPSLTDSDISGYDPMHMIVVIGNQYGRNQFTISVRLASGLTYAGEDEVENQDHKTEETAPILTPAPSARDSGKVTPIPAPSQKPKPRTKCPKCTGGEVQCSQCGGSGGKWIYDHSTRSTGRTWEKCFKCKGAGKLRCTYCGGDGWLND